MGEQRNKDGTFKAGNSFGNRFDSDNQPEGRGRKGKSVTDWLRDYGDAKEIEFEVTVTKSNDQKKKIKGKVESATSINQLIATTIVKKAVEGDNKAINTFLDRTEGKPQQYIDVTSQGASVVWQEEKTYEADNKTDEGS